MKLSVATATNADAAAIAALRTAVAERLTHDFGKGHWSSCVTERGVLLAIRTSRVVVIRSRSKLIATLTLATKKPWAIDKSYFAPSKRPLYLTNMAVRPDLQRLGIGRRCLDEARRIARVLPADAIRLDAYNTDAGAGGFYAKCGFREVGRVIYRNTPLSYFELLL